MDSSGHTQGWSVDYLECNEIGIGWKSSQNGTEMFISLMIGNQILILRDGLLIVISKDHINKMIHNFLYFRLVMFLFNEII